MLYRLALTLTEKKTSFTFLFRPWVPDLNLNKSLEPMSETPCKPVLLALKIFFNSLYTLNSLFLHIPECNLLITKFLNALFIQDTVSFFACCSTDNTLKTRV